MRQLTEDRSVIYPVRQNRDAEKAGLLTRGSRPRTAFPMDQHQWRLGTRLLAYSCGYSQGIAINRITLFPIGPYIFGHLF